MGEVWSATDEVLGRNVAVKVLRREYAEDPAFRQRFRAEAQHTAALTHPGIAAIYDYDDGSTTDGPGQSPFLVMENVPGEPLSALLTRAGVLPPDPTLDVIGQAALALQAAHDAGVIHRDVKPGNILITPDGRVLLTDFGIAKGLGANGDDLTSANVMMGTAKYLSPEQVRGKKLDGRADLYSLGLVLYECLAGRVPFLGETDTDTALARLNRDPTDLARLRPTLPYGLAELIHRLLARRPMDRFATGAELRAALLQISKRPVDPTDATDAAPSSATRRATGEVAAVSGS
jgi:serine/threonine-protein kinase